MVRCLVLLGVLLTLSSGCRVTTGLSNFNAQVGDVSALKVSTHSSAGAHALLEPGGGPQVIKVPTGQQTIEVRRTRDSIFVDSNAGTKSLAADGQLIPVERLLDLDAQKQPIDLELVRGVKPERRISWVGSATTDRTDFEHHRGKSTFTEHSVVFTTEGTWGRNVKGVAAVEHGSGALRLVGYVGAVAAYLTGAALIAVQANRLKEREHGAAPVSWPMVGVGAGVIVLGIPLFILGKRNGNRVVSVFP
jgi:hypothetical protein